MTTQADLDARGALAERLVDDVTRALETLGVYLGLEFGLYQSLNDLGAATEAEIAVHAGIALATPASGSSSRRPPATSPATTPRARPSNAATSCLWGMARCCWTPTAPTTPRRSRSSSRASPGCCRSCWRPTAAAAASPTPPTGRSCGTVLRASTVARWAAAAGFTGFEVPPIDNPFWRFYRLQG